MKINYDRRYYTLGIITIAWGISLVALFLGVLNVIAGENIPHLTFFIGDVQTKTSGDNDWSAAELNEELNSKSQIKTADESRAEITLTDNTVIRVGEDSEYELDSLLSGKDSFKSDSKLNRGRLWVNIRKLAGKNARFSARTPTAVAAVRGTVFRMDVNDGDSTTALYVYRGIVEVGGPQWAPDYGKMHKLKAPTQVKGPKEVSINEWTEIVRAQQKLLIGPKGVISKEQFDIQSDKKDDWVLFNIERDSLLSMNEKY